MRVSDWFTPAERRLAFLLFMLSLIGSSAHCGRRLSPEVASWLENCDGRKRPETCPRSVPGPGPQVAGEASGTRSPAVGFPKRTGKTLPSDSVGSVNPNRATADELMALPGIGPALAGRILADRARNGPYRKAEDLLRVRGIGPATLDRMRPRLNLP